MKRYTCLNDVALISYPTGPLMKVTDLQAWALRHKATVENIPCQVAKRGELTYECDATNPCDACVARENALREIEELINGN